MNHFEIYQQSVKNLKTNPHSATDKFIVDQWKALRNLTNEISKVVQEVKDLRKDNGDMYLKNDLLESQLAKALGTPVVWKMPTKA